MKTPDRFIVVDDDTINNMLCSYALRKFFSEPDIQLFKDPDEALEAIEKEYCKTDLTTVLFLDMNMPAMTGWEFLDTFKDFNPDILKQFTVYILTSSVDHRDKNKADVNPMVSGFFSKPLSLDVLTQIFADVHKVEQRA